MTTSFLVGTSGKLPCSGNVLIFLVMVGSSLLPCLQFSSVSLIRFSRPTYTVNVSIACTPCSFCAIFGFFYFLLGFSVVLTEVLVSRGIVMSMRRQVLSFLFFSRVSGLLAAMVLSVWMDMSPEWCCCPSY